MIHKLIPFGAGSEISAVNLNSWYIIIKDTMYIFDAPITNLRYFTNKTTAKRLLNGIEHVRIFVSHCHEHAIGGLGSLISLLRDKYNIDTRCFAPIKIWMHVANYLETVGLSIRDIGFDKGDYYQDDNLQVFPRETAHSSSVMTFGYIMYIDTYIDSTGANWNVAYYPNAMNFVDDPIMESYLTMNPDFNEKVIYHDITSDPLDVFHCYKDKITRTLIKEQRKNIIPMNLKAASEVKKFEKLGFNTSIYNEVNCF